MKRSQRLVAISQILMAKPNILVPLTLFAEMFNAAKSTISEDLVAIKETLAYSGQGRLETVPGVAGGVRYIPEIKREEANRLLADLADKLSCKERILPGGFLYMTDLVYNPSILRSLGLIFARAFREKSPDIVVTMETKGIPLALFAAEALGVPLEIIRHGNKVTEGSTLSINYVSGSTNRVQSMSLSRRALESGQKVLLIDDFMKAGGTALGMMNLMQEFGADVVGVGVFMEGCGDYTGKLIQGYVSLLRLVDLDPNSGSVKIIPQDIAE